MNGDLYAKLRDKRFVAETLRGNNKRVSMVTVARSEAEIYEFLSFYRRRVSSIYGSNNGR